MEILGNKDDSDFYTKLRGKIINAYRRNFTDGKGKLKKEFQTAYVLPVYFNMAKGKEKQTMAANLNRLIIENGYKLSTGFTGTPFLLFALSDNGYIDTAYRVLLQEECPGWMYEVKAGGTTIWERWDALRADGTVNTGSLVNGKEDKNGGMVSFNHYANGAVGDWLYRRIAGIEPVSGGYRRFRIAPRPGGRLTWTRGSLKTPFGTIISEWTIKKEIFYIRVQVPVSTECTLCLPDGEEKILKSGNYEFKCKI